MIANFLNQLVQVATLAEPILGVAAGAAEGAEIGAILGPLGVIAGVAIGGGIALATMHLAENYHRHDIECKSKKDARDKAQKYGGGVPPEGPHNDSFGSQYHPRRQRHDEFEKIPNVHFKYKSNKPFIYKIQKGDCLSKIASKYDVKTSLLQKWNNIKNPDLIYEGKTLKIFK